MLLEAVKDKFDHVCGYDNDPEMVNRSREKGLSTTQYFSHIDLECFGHKTALNLSSVIHEVYSYSSEEDIINFWDRVFRSSFEYICIRDMMIDFNENKKISPEYLDAFAHYILAAKEDEQKRAVEFADTWGTLHNKREFIHYLLKRRYVENWEREVKENYLPITVSELLRMIPDNYEIVYKNHYILPFFKEVTYRETGIDIVDPTHLKLILRRKS